jgi:Tfp pilus assembly protein PilF
MTPDATLIRAAALQQAGDLEAAVEAYREAISLDPQSPIGYNSLGQIFASLKDLDTALIFFNAAVALAPGSPEIHNNLATLHLKQDNLELAATHFQQAASLSPRNPIYPNHLGQVLLAQGDTAGAEASIRHALALDPACAEAYVNLGYLHSLQLQFAQAEASYRQAIALKPDLAQVHVNLSQLLLRLGNFSEGWAEHEWRWQWKEFPSPRRAFSQPQWRGEPVSSTTIFLHAEQGFGDTIQFLRYVPLLAARGGTIVLEVHPELRQIAATLPGVTTLIARGDPIPSFDLHCPLMSLPLAFGTTLETIPATTPYLAVTRPAPVWIAPSSHLKVGLVWAGSPKNVIDAKRSLTLDALRPIFEVPRVSFYSLQLGAAASNLFVGSLPANADFADTAAAIAALDLVITVDTAVAHLAGALGKPVWILLPALPDWRWLLDRDDSPWYPSARLFRQTRPGQWASVIDQVAAALANLAVN